MRFKGEIHFSLDVEASGPIPGPYWMPSFGICRCDDINVGFKRLLQPLDEACPDQFVRFYKDDDPEAMRVVAQGTPDFKWDPKLSDENNTDDLYQYYCDNGVHPLDAMHDLKEWMMEQTENRAYLPVIIGAPATFDFMWLFWYWQYFLEEMPSFGFSGLDLRSYFMGAHSKPFLGTGKRSYKKHYPCHLPHSHDPLDDAREQGFLWQAMFDANSKKPLKGMKHSCNCGGVCK